MGGTQLNNQQQWQQRWLLPFLSQWHAKTSQSIKSRMSNHAEEGCGLNLYAIKTIVKEFTAFMFCLLFKLKKIKLRTVIYIQTLKYTETNWGNLFWTEKAFKTIRVKIKHINILCDKVSLSVKHFAVKTRFFFFFKENQQRKKPANIWWDKTCCACSWRGATADTNLKFF